VRSSTLRTAPRRSLAFAAAAAVAASLAASAPALATRPTATPLRPGNLTRGPVKIHDRVFSGRVPAGLRARVSAAQSEGNGGTYTTPSGAAVRVFTSPRYSFDPGVNQTYANFLDSLVHGDELASLTVYIAPFDEMQQICSPTALACYFPGDERLVTTGDPSPQPNTTVEDVVTHEYGHHVANHRLNDLGPAVEWGPEYWATYESVCWRQAHGTAFPGDESDNYALNPGEAWAETYRLANGSQEPWDSSDPSFYPDAGALDAARRDVLDPYSGGEVSGSRGRFRSRGSSRRDLPIAVDYDGVVDLRLRGSGTLDADLYVLSGPDSKRPLAKATATGHNEHLRHRVCGYRQLDVAVKRYRGSGSFRLRLRLPSGPGS
jgi:hypothetical protein